MQLARIAHGAADIADRKAGQLQKFRRFAHSVADQEFLRRLAYGVTEDLAEIAAVQVAEGRDVLHGDIVLEILLNEGQRLPPVCTS